MQALVYFMPHIAVLLGGIALWDVCSAATLADLSSARVFTIAGAAIVVALIGCVVDQEA